MDLLLNTAGEIAVYIESDGSPATGREVYATLTSPRGAVVFTERLAAGLGDGWYLCAITGDELITRGTWQADWIAPGEPAVALTSFHQCGWVRPGTPTLGDLRLRIAREAGMLAHAGQIAAGTTATTLVDPSLVFGADGEYAGCWVWFTSGTSVSQARRVTGFVAATTALTVAPGFDEAPALGTRFQLLRMGVGLRPGDLTDLINSAIASLADRAYLPRQDESLVTIADQADYDVPAGFEIVNRVDLWDDENERYEEVGITDWSLDGTTIRLVSAPTDSDLALRLHGTMAPEGLYWDAQYVEVMPEYVVAFAIESLHAALGGGQATDPDDHRRAEAFYASKTEAYRRRAIGRLPANARQVG